MSIRRNRVSKNATPFACDASPVPPPVTPLPLAPSSTRRAVTRAAREDVRISAFPATKHVTNEVIVFGYPPQKAAMVLKRFHKYGTIIKRVDGAGNWTHITYMEPAEAQMALTQNGKVIDFDTMIGVKMVRAASSDRDGGLGMGLGGIDSEPNQSSRVSTFSSRMDAERTPLHSRLANKGRGLGSITGAGAGIGLRERGRPAVGPGSGLGVSSRNGGHVGALSSKNIMADKSGRYLNAFPRKSFCTKLKEHLFNW